MEVSHLPSTRTSLQTSNPKPFAFAFAIAHSVCSQRFIGGGGEKMKGEGPKITTTKMPRASMTLKRRVRDPFILGNDQPFFKGQKETPGRGNHQSKPSSKG